MTASIPRRVTSPTLREDWRNSRHYLERMTDAMAGTITALDSGFDSSAEHLRDAALSMNTVATRVLDELGDGRGGRR